MMSSLNLILFLHSEEIVYVLLQMPQSITLLYLQQMIAQRNENLTISGLSQLKTVFHLYSKSTTFIVTASQTTSGFSIGKSGFFHEWKTLKLLKLKISITLP